MTADVHASVTRIADLAGTDYAVEALPRSAWETGDYVLARVTERPAPKARVENPVGRRVELMEGETVVGALGTRRATRGLVGGFRDVEADGQMSILTGGGVFGRVTSASPYTVAPIEIEYEGHVHVDGEVARMDQHAVSGPAEPLRTPVVLLMGTSMSAGKTLSGRVVCRLLVEAGYQVAAGKITGAGTYNDALSMGVAGADAIYDFVDGGLPTTVVPEARYRSAIRPVLGRLQAEAADVIVTEIGASPLEPYNGEAAVDLIGDQVAFTLLCATDPYAVIGIQDAFDMRPDLVAGIATNTSAGIDLIEELTETPALNLQDEAAKDPLRDMLLDALG